MGRRWEGRAGAAGAAAVLVVLAACGHGDPAASGAGGGGGTTGPATVPSIPVDCTGHEPTQALATGQDMAFDGTVTAITTKRNREADRLSAFLDDGRVGPEPPRQDESVLSDPEAGAEWPWTTFEVHAWYTNDFGPEITIWTAGLDLAVGDRLLIAGEAFATPYYVDESGAQSGMAIACASRPWTEADADTWSGWFGGSVAAGGTEPEGDPDPAVVDQVDAGRARWREAEPRSYSATINLYDGSSSAPSAPAGPPGGAGECPADGDIRIEVTGGEVIAATNVTRACHIDLGSTDVPTIDDLFDAAATASGAKDHQVIIDPDWGFPSSFSGTGRAVDLGGSVSAFTPGRATTLVGAEVTEQLAAQRAAWADAGLTDYRFVLEWRCFCPGGPIEMTVRDGRPVSAKLRDSSVVDPVAAVPEQAPRTIDAVFDYLAENAPRSDAVVATFDDRRGYPAMVAFDFARNAIDDELTFVVRDVEPLDG